MSNAIEKMGGLHPGITMSLWPNRIKPLFLESGVSAVQKRLKLWFRRSAGRSMALREILYLRAFATDPDGPQVARELQTLPLRSSVEEAIERVFSNIGLVTALRHADARVIPRFITRVASADANWQAEICKRMTRASLVVIYCDHVPPPGSGLAWEIAEAWSAVEPKRLCFLVSSPDSSVWLEQSLRLPNSALGGHVSNVASDWDRQRVVLWFGDRGQPIVRRVSRWEDDSSAFADLEFAVLPILESCGAPRIYLLSARLRLLSYRIAAFVPAALLRIVRWALIPLAVAINALSFFLPRKSDPAMLKAGKFALICLLFAAYASYEGQIIERRAEAEGTAKFEEESRRVQRQQDEFEKTLKLCSDGAVRSSSPDASTLDPEDGDPLEFGAASRAVRELECNFTTLATR